MTTSRLAVGTSAALFSALLSIDPRVRAIDRGAGAIDRGVGAIDRGAGAIDRGVGALDRGAGAVDAGRAEPVAAEGAINRLAAPVPGDVTLTISPESGRSQRVVVRRPGYLVALLHGAARSAGKDWAALRVQVPEASGGRGEPRPGEEIDRLVWEATKLGGLATERGLVSLSLAGGSLSGALALSAAPAPAGELRTPHAACVAHHDGASGFTALCRVDRAARHVAAANVTGVHVAEGAVVASDQRMDPLVRLDLPLAPGRGEARVIGFTVGRVGHALRVEASWVEGETPALLFSEAERAQPQSFDFVEPQTSRGWSRP